MPKDKITLIVNLIQEMGQEVLDVGCADGGIAQRLQALGKRVVGIEAVSESAAQAGRFSDQVVVGNIETEEPFEQLKSLGRLYHVILCSEVLEHLVHPDRVLRKLRPFLYPEGFLVVVLPNVAFYKTRLQLLLGRWNYAPQGILDRTHLKFFTLKTGQALLVDAGFRILTLQATHYSRRFAFLYDFFARRRPSLFGERFVILAKPENLP